MKRIIQFHVFKGDNQYAEQAVKKAQAKLRPLVGRPLSESKLKQALREWS